MARKITRGEQPKQGKKVANKTGGKKAAAERLIKDLQKNAKDSGEDLPGLDALIDSIKKEVNENEKKEKKKKKESKKKISALVQEVTDNNKDQKEDKKEKEVIDERVFEILGLEDNGDLDYEEVTSLIKEYLVKNQEEEKEGDTESLKTALKNVKGKEGKFEAKKKKTVTASGFKGEKKDTPGQGVQVVDKDKFIPTDDDKQTDQLKGEGLNEEQIDELKEELKAEVEEKTKEQLVPLSKSLSEIEQNLQSLLDVNKKKLKIEKQQARDAKKKAESEGFKKTEAKLEGKDGKGKGIFKGMKKALKPVAGIFDAIGNFFTNVLLGMAVQEILKFIEDPAAYLKGITDFFNNTVIKFINDIIDYINLVILEPVNAFINAFNAGINEIEFAINSVAKILGTPQVKFPDIPNAAIPHVPNIPDGFNFQKQEDGGTVLNVNNLSLFDGGAIDGKTGMTITGMGKDTQLIAAQPGEVMMSKKAVDAYGADTLLGMNSSAGGNNKPKFGKIPGFQDGGQVGKVIIGAGHAPTVENAARGIMLGSDGRSVQGTADDGSSGRNTPGNATGVREWEATKHVVDTLKRLVQERGLTDKIGFQDIYSWKGLSGVPRSVESTSGQQYVDLHFDARGFGKTGVLPSRNESATDRSLMNVFGRYSDSFDPSSKGVTAGGGTLLELAAIDDPAIRSLLEEVKRGEQGPASMEMAEKILRGILPSIQGAPPVPPQAPQVEMPEGDMSQAPPAPVLPPPPGGAKVARTKVDVNVQPYSAPQRGGGPTVAVPVGQQQVNSAAVDGGQTVPSFSAEDLNNFDLVVVKSIYNIVG